MTQPTATTPPSPCPPDLDTFPPYESVAQTDPDDPIPDGSGYQLTAMHKDGNVGYYEGKTMV